MWKLAIAVIGLSGSSCTTTDKHCQHTAECKDDETCTQFNFCMKGTLAPISVNAYLDGQPIARFTFAQRSDPDPLVPIETKMIITNVGFRTLDAMSFFIQLKPANRGGEVAFEMPDSVFGLAGGAFAPPKLIP